MSNQTKQLPTYEEWTKDMSLTDQIKFHYDYDLREFLPEEWVIDPWELSAEIATDPNWLNEFNKNFEESLIEREYIQ